MELMVKCQEIKMKAKRGQLGRSMVEMLGVLAIIGVLSVGAIAGYQKAMFKYKLNKQAEQLNQVINTVAINARNFNDLSSTESKPIMPYLIKLGEIPTEMIKDSTTEIYDVFGISLFSGMNPAGVDPTKGIPGITSLFFSFDLNMSDNQTREICRNVFSVIKENSGSIYYVYSATAYGTEDARISYLYGDNHCSAGKKCLKNLSLKTIDEECAIHQGNTRRGSIVALWKL